jgi:hypothetical protein
MLRNVLNTIGSISVNLHDLNFLQIKRESSHNHGILKSLEKLAKLVGTTTNEKLYSFLIYLEQPLADDIGVYIQTFFNKHDNNLIILTNLYKPFCEFYITHNFGTGLFTVVNRV